MATQPPSKKARSTYDGDDLELKCINSVRVLSAEQPQAANSGHPGAPMGCAPMAHVLWGEVMKFAPSKPDWIARDRFVLSNGHACALLYSMLHLTGYDLSIEDLQKFRQTDSRTPGHPESFLTPGVEVCTGPLGQGISQAVGMAMAQRHLTATYSTPDFPAVFDNFTYVICGDGCLQEGVSSETGSLAGHLGLGRLIVLYDDNKITIDGSTDLSFTEDVARRYEAYGWHVQTVDDISSGLADLRAALEQARNEHNRPSLIKIRTSIGYGSALEGNAKVHGAPLGEEDLENVKKRFGFDSSKSFCVDDDVRAYYRKAATAGEAQCTAWETMFDQYAEAHPEKAAEIRRRFAGQLPSDVEEKVYKELPTFTVGTDKDLATRKFSELCLNALAPQLPELMGGSADLTPSNLTALKCSGDFQKASPAGRYIRFGVREHGMSAICNGIFAYGGMRPFCATFLNFAGYALGAIRLSALSRFGVLYIMTHDSIGLGEDGPTHQPVEMLESLRAMPNLNTVRPADCNETAAAYRMALEARTTPTVICCSRSSVPGLAESTVEKALKGAYIVHSSGSDGETPNVILVASGSEVGPCIAAAKEWTDVKVRVVSMPCQEVFLQQSIDYQRSVLPGNIPTLSVEASSPHGWHRFSHAQIALHRFGVSGPGKHVFAKFGFTRQNIVQKAKALVAHYQNHPVPDLMDRPLLDDDDDVKMAAH